MIFRKEMTWSRDRSSREVVFRTMVQRQKESRGDLQEEDEMESRQIESRGCLQDDGAATEGVAR